MMSEFFPQKTNLYCSKSEKDKIYTIFLLEASFTQWRSSEHMKSSLDNPAESFSVKLLKNFAGSPKTIRL